MPNPDAASELHIQLSVVIETLEQELSELENARDKLALEIEVVLYRNTARGERRSGQRRSRSDRRQDANRKNTAGRRVNNNDRRLPQEERIGKLQAQITALVETIDVLKSRRIFLMEKGDDSSIIT